MAYFPSNNPIRVRIPASGTHKDTDYNPLKTTRHDKAVLLPRDHLSKFARDGMVEPGIHIQQALLMAAADYLKTAVVSMKQQRVACEEQLEQLNRGSGMNWANTPDKKNEIAQIQKKINDTFKSISSLVASEQKAGQTAAELAVELYALDETIANLIPTREYLAQKLSSTLTRVNPLSPVKWDALAKWAEQEMVDLPTYISSVQAHGIHLDIESYLGSVRDANGSGHWPKIPSITQAEWCSASHESTQKIQAQSKLISDRISAYQDELAEEKGRYHSIINMLEGKPEIPTQGMMLVSNLFDRVDDAIFKNMGIDNSERVKRGLEPIRNTAWMPGGKRLLKSKEISVLKIKQAELRLQFAQQLGMISKDVAMIDERMGALLELNRAKNAFESEMSSASSKPTVDQAMISGLNSQIAALDKSIAQNEAIFSEVQAAIERMSQTFKDKQDHAVRKKEKAEERAAAIEAAAEAQKAERESRLMYERARLSAIISKTKPNLAKELWRKDRYKFCKPDNEHLVLAEFESAVLKLASLYVENGGQITADALDKAFEAGNAIHWETDFVRGRVLARIALTTDKNYRILVYLDDITNSEKNDPVVLFVGAHPAFERYLKESLMGKPRADWVPEWAIGLFERTLKDAVNAHAELAKLESPDSV